MWPSVALSHRQLNTKAVRVSFGRSVAELVVGWMISRPDVNMSRTCRDDGSCGRTGVARAGKAAEQSAERPVSRPST